jgi:hypothetical protein
MIRVGKRLAAAAAFVALGGAAMVAAPAPAPARVFVGVGVGVPCCGAPWPYYYGYPNYYGYPAYYPPPPYYAPPAPAGYPPPPAGYPPQAPAPAAAGPAPQITYTSRPPFTNAAGQTCREYRTAAGATGTACRDAGGQWRVMD